jgi:CDP-glycerol glycerophosphotransferase
VNLLPIDPKSIFVNNFDGKGVDGSCKFVAEMLHERDPKVRIYWLVDKSECNFKNIVFVRKGTLRAVVKQGTSKIWISNVRMPAYSIKRKEQIYIQTWHGTFAIKKIENECPEALTERYIWKAKHDSKMTDYYISSNKDNSNTFKNYFWRDKGKILEIGDPKDDQIINASLSDVANLKRKYKVENKNVCLYAPTFRKDYSLDAYDIDYDKLLLNLKKKFGGDWILFIRLHPTISSKAEQLIKYNNRIVNASFIQNSEELLIITDFLITDYSSICFDFLFRRKPIVLYASDIEDYKKDRSFHVPLNSLPFPLVTNNTDFEKIILNFNLTDYNIKIDKFLKQYRFVLDGNATLRMCELIEKNMN